MAHDALTNGKNKKNDEFYTKLVDIEAELRFYKNHFKDKTVFCNCDDPYESNFFKYFAMNFNSLGLKKLITTGYVNSPIVGTELDILSNEEEDLIKRVPYVAYINEVKDLNGDGRIDLEDIKILLKEKGNCRRKLKGEIIYKNNEKIVYPAGDFRSSESIKLLMQSDIVVTNPPFSVAREYIDLLMKYKKKFLIIGDLNWITYKNVFPLLKNNLIWLGYTSVKEFIQKDGSIKKFGNKLWFTNLDIPKLHEKIDLYKEFNPDEYPKYDNYNVIEVSKVSDIPMDYNGLMGVPVSFMSKFNPDQFEIVGMAEDNGKGFSGKEAMWDGKNPHCIVNGNKMYKRIFIKKK